MENYDVSTLLGTGAFAQVYRARDRRTDRRVALKVVIVDGVLDSKRRKRKEQEGERGEWFDGGAAMNDGRSASPSASLPPLSSGGRHSSRQTVWDALSREITVHRAASSTSSSYSHPNIVLFLGSFSTSKEVGIVLEFCPWGDLQSHMRHVRDWRKAAAGSADNFTIRDSQTGNKTFIREDEVRHVLSQLLRGLAFLHSRGIVHRDIKAGNIFLCPGPRASTSEDLPSIGDLCILDHGLSLLDCKIKIGDFGLAVQMNDNDDWNEALHTICGTPSCLAPEVALSTPKSGVAKAAERRERSEGDSSGTIDLLSGDCDSLLNVRNSVSENRGHGQPADLWSTGCLLYAMLVGRYPFSSPQKLKNMHESNQAQSRNRNQRIQETIDRALRGEWSFPHNITMSENARSLVVQLLSHDPPKRGFSRGILASHQFFKVRSNKLPLQPSNKTGSKEFNKSMLAVDGRPPRPFLGKIEGETFHGKKIFRGKENKSLQINIDDMPTIKGVSSISDNQARLPCDSRQQNKATELVSKNLHPSARWCHELSYSTSQSLVSSNTLEATQKKQDNCRGRQNTQSIIDMSPHVPRSYNDHKNIARSRLALVPEINSYGENTDLNSTFLRKEQYRNGRRRNNEANGIESDELRSHIHLQDSNHPCLHVHAHDDSIEQISFLDPIEGIGRLPSMKHHWKETKRINNPNGSSQAILHTLYILPGPKGVIITCENIDHGGLWMHLTVDGFRVSAGKLARTSHQKTNRISEHSLNRNSHPLVLEAFSRAPKQVRKSSVADSFLGAKNFSSPLSATVANMSFATGTTSVSAHSLPYWSTANNKKLAGKHKPLYKPLSSLLAKKNRAYLCLYRKLERIILSIKQCIPKITLYLHSPKVEGCNVKFSNDFCAEKTQTESTDMGGLVAKTMLMENSPFPHVDTIFVDGITVRYQMSSGHAELVLPDTLRSVVVDFVLHSQASRENNSITKSTSPQSPESPLPIMETSPISKEMPCILKQYTNHIILAQNAAEECLFTENQYEMAQPYIGGQNNPVSIFPLIKRMVANGSKRNMWVDIVSCNK